MHRRSVQLHQLLLFTPLWIIYIPLYHLAFQFRLILALARCISSALRINYPYIYSGRSIFFFILFSSRFQLSFKIFDYKLALSCFPLPLWRASFPRVSSSANPIRAVFGFIFPPLSAGQASPGLIGKDESVERRRRKKERRARLRVNAQGETANSWIAIPRCVKPESWRTNKSDGFS